MTDDLRATAVLSVALLSVVACSPQSGDRQAAAQEESSSAAEQTEARAPAEAPEAASEDGQSPAATQPGRETAPLAEEERPSAGEESPSPEAAAAEEETVPVRTVPAGTQVWAALSDSLHSETAEVGDRFSAEVSSPVTDDAYVLVPSGARLHGRVTDVRPARGDSAAMIALAFDSVTVRDHTLPVETTVTDVKLKERSKLKGEGKKIGLGAAAGAVVGAVVGKDVKGALIGAAGGAAAGTGIALGTRAQYAVLPAGSEITLNLDRPLEVPLPRD